jgi:predicted enzyme related to lactoylglutathione lyase
MQARVVHFEIPYDDPARAGEFYSSVFGWDVMPMPDMSYTMVMTGPSGDTGPTEPGYINGGMYSRREGFTAPNLVLAVDSIDEALNTVEKAGGTVVQSRQPVGDMGFTGYFRDSEGNLVGLWENAAGTG